MRSQLEDGKLINMFLGRTGFYDEYGVICDVIQNHLSEILYLLAINLEGADTEVHGILNEKRYALLQHIYPLSAEDVLLGQYKGISVPAPELNSKDIVIVWSKPWPNFFIQFCVFNSVFCLLRISGRSCLRIWSKQLIHPDFCRYGSQNQHLRGVDASLIFPKAVCCENKNYKAVFSTNTCRFITRKCHSHRPDCNQK